MYCDLNDIADEFFTYITPLVTGEVNLVYENGDNTMAEIIDYCVNYNVNPIEITDPRNLGMTKRDGNVILVLLDNGFNDDVANQYYSRKK